MNNDVLLAIPFFTFMGLVLERSGMAEDLLDTIGQMFGTVRGGLAYAVIFVGALLAATTGVVAASVISMGLISLPIMLRYGYDRRVASGVIAASGTLAQIIPPSLVLIVMADQLGRSVGDMYEGRVHPRCRSCRPLRALHIHSHQPIGHRGTWLAAGRCRVPRARWQPRSDIARHPCCLIGSARLFRHAGSTLSRGRFRDPDDGGGHRDRILSRRVELDLLQDHRVADFVASRPAGDVRHGAAAVPHILGARHDFHRRGDADRRRGNGRDRLNHSRRVQAFSRPQSQSVQLRRC